MLSSFKHLLERLNRNKLLSSVYLGGGFNGSCTILTANRVNLWQHNAAARKPICATFSEKE